MFNKIMLEKNLSTNPIALKVLKKLGKKEPILIDSVDSYFGKYYKPYLQKRDNLNLFLGSKKGTIVKMAPPAYGINESLHFYFIHSYNCIYECEYCYLQGYFKSPDIVLFINYEQIVNSIENKIQEHPRNKEIWFHAGEFSDSLALSHLTGELEYYYAVFKKYPNALLELRTKSANIKSLLSIKPLENVFISYSLSPARQIKEIDHKTPHLAARLKAIKKLQDHGHRIALHFDPIIGTKTVLNDYQELLESFKEYEIDLTKIAYLSLGVVRFTDDVFTELKKNYPESKIFKKEFIKSFDNKKRYLRPYREKLLNDIKQMCKIAGISSKKIYFCME